MSGYSEDCERCGKPSSKRYAFHYGRHTAPATLGPEITQVTPTFVSRARSVTYHYSVGGVDSVPLCGRCVLRARVRGSLAVLWREVSGTLFVLFFIVMGCLAVVGLAFQGDWGTAALVAVGLVAAVAAGFLIAFALCSSADAGESAAIDVRRPALQSRGWSEFWTSKQFARLT